MYHIYVVCVMLYKQLKIVTQFTKPVLRHEIYFFKQIKTFSCISCCSIYFI